VVCLDGLTTFYLDTGKGWLSKDTLNVWRAALQPSPLFAGEAERMLTAIEAKFGTRKFAVLHARVEWDFRQHCQGLSDSEKRRNGRRCMAEDAEIATVLREAVGLEPGTLLFVCSSAEDVVASLPSTCQESGFVCFTRDDVYQDMAAAIVPQSLSFAFLDFVLATYATTMFGNSYSTFSTELLILFQERGKFGWYYNLECPVEGVCP
jgi:hypothetical protein